MKVIKAPKPLNVNGMSVFLAGSIEMGIAENWQEKVVRLLDGYNITILNPRRDDWDSTWVQSMDNPQFREQVEWELKAQEMADVIAMYFDINTKSPITLLELGLFVRSGVMIVCCPDGFWRKGNVDIVCNKYGTLQVPTIYDMIDEIILKIKEYGY